MHKNFIKLLAAGMIPLYTDTDSIYVWKPAAATIPLPLGSAFGCFEDEHPRTLSHVRRMPLELSLVFLADQEIVKKMALGLKSYQILLASSTGEERQEFSHVTKIRGFTLKGKAAVEALKNDKFEMFVSSLLQQRSKRVHIPHFNILRERTSRQLYSVISRKLLRNDVFTQRVAFKGYHYTLPYGYSESLKNQYVFNNVMSRGEQ